jgi:hypothetical protein
MNTHTACMYCSVSSIKEFWTKVNRRIFRIFKTYFVQHCFICRLDFTVSEDAGIKPRTVASLVLAVRHSNQSTSSHPPLGLISTNTRLDLIHTRLCLIHTRLDLIHARLDLIHTRLYFIHNSARSNSQLGYISSTNQLELIHNSARSHPQFG